MAKLQRRDISAPTERVDVPLGQLDMFDLGALQVGHQVFQPGWRWSTSVKPYAGTEWCEFHHIGYTLSGHVHVTTRDGAEMEVGPGQFYEFPPGHDAWVVGDEPWDTLDWAPSAAFGRAASGSERRVVATMLFTDIVASTAMAQAIGDIAWRDRLTEHDAIVRKAIDRFRAREIATTGDGFVVLFDGADRAIRAGRAIITGMADLGMSVRIGIHTGEVELYGDDVRGVAVHVAARVMAVAGADEIVVSWTTRDLLEGAPVELEPLGQHELKGIDEPKPLYRVVG